MENKDKYFAEITDILIMLTDIIGYDSDKNEHRIAFFDAKEAINNLFNKAMEDGK